MLGFEIDDSFGTIYLNNIPAECNDQDKHLLKILLGKKAVTKKCLNKEPPAKGEWIMIVNGMYEMEKLTFSQRLPWIHFINIAPNGYFT